MWRVFCVTSSFVKYRAPGIKIKFGEIDECTAEKPLHEDGEYDTDSQSPAKPQ